jgi:RNA polymerase sigma-70 factor (ECF subfamily)
MNELSDAELVAATQRGDQRAFAALVHRYRDRHLRFVARLLGDVDEAEDVLQSAFVRAHRHIRSCSEPARFGAWLHRIVVNESRTRATRKGRREQRLVRGEDTLARLEADGEVAADVALQRRIEEAVGALTPELREAFLLKHVEELEYEEMVEVTGAGVSALKMRVKRACERLREQLEEVVDD